MLLEKLLEFKNEIQIFVNGKKVTLPKYPSVNGNIVTGSYEIKEGDDIEFLDYVTVDQIKIAMDIIVEKDVVCMVNNKEATADTKVYENFEVIWKLLEKPAEEWLDDEEEAYDSVMEETSEELTPAKADNAETKSAPVAPEKKTEDVADKAKELLEEEEPELPKEPITIYVMVNGKPVAMSGKPRYVFVDVFNFINFDLSRPQGAIVTTVNGHDANYMEELHDKDIIEIYWRKQ
jgi:translation initiation factor 2 alpha subunit (eIF-2alpha)